MMTQQNLLGEWRNGSRAGFRNQSRKRWRFESSLAHKIVILSRNLCLTFKIQYATIYIGLVAHSISIPRQRRPMVTHLQLVVLLTFSALYLVFQTIGNLFDLGSKKEFHLISVCIVVMTTVLCLKPILDTFPISILVLGSIVIAHAIKYAVLRQLSSPMPSRLDYAGLR